MHSLCPDLASRVLSEAAGVIASTNAYFTEVIKLIGKNPRALLSDPFKYHESILWDVRYNTAKAKPNALALKHRCVFILFKTNITLALNFMYAYIKSIKPTPLEQSVLLDLLLIVLANNELSPECLRAFVEFLSIPRYAAILVVYDVVTLLMRQPACNQECVAHAFELLSANELLHGELRKHTVERYMLQSMESSKECAISVYKFFGRIKKQLTADQLVISNVLFGVSYDNQIHACYMQASITKRTRVLLVLMVSI